MLKAATRKALTEGEGVCYVLTGDSRNVGAVRPAAIVRVWRGADGCAQENGLVNLIVFVDGSNDYPSLAAGGVPVLWKTSVCHDDNREPGTWHYIDETPEAKEVDDAH